MPKFRHDPFSELSFSDSSGAEEEEPSRAPPIKKQATGNGAAVATSSPRGNTASSNEASRASASREKSAAPWIKKWQDAGYPKALLQQISQFHSNPAPKSFGAIAGLDNIPIPNAVHKAMALATGGDSNAKAGSSPAVYLVTYIQHGPYVDFEHKVLGTYTNVAAANEHLLGYIPSYNGMTHIMEMRDWQRGVKADSYEHGVFWDVNTNGCLTILVNGKNGQQKIDCTLQEVRDKPPPTLETLKEKKGGIGSGSVLYPDVPDDWVSEF
ncbi:hypothetical protein PG990_002769 [Apiospora arundinis]